MTLSVKNKSSEESGMLTGNARSPLPEPVRTRIPDGLKFSPFSSRRKIPSEAKSEGGENIRVKKTHDFSEVGFFSRLRNLPMGWALPDTPEGALPRIAAMAAGRC